VISLRHTAAAAPEDIGRGSGCGQGHGRNEDQLCELHDELFRENGVTGKPKKRILFFVYRRMGGEVIGIAVERASLLDWQEKSDKPNR